MVDRTEVTLSSPDAALQRRAVGSPCLSPPWYDQCIESRCHRVPPGEEEEEEEAVGRSPGYSPGQAGRPGLARCVYLSQTAPVLQGRT